VLCLSTFIPVIDDKSKTLPLSTIALVKAEAEMLFREAPTAIESAGIEVLILDQITAAMATVADHLKRPFITVCNALPVNREPGVPPYFTAWAYNPSPWAQGAQPNR